MGERSGWRGIRLSIREGTIGNISLLMMVDGHCLREHHSTSVRASLRGKYPSSYWIVLEAKLRFK